MYCFHMDKTASSAQMQRTNKMEAVVNNNINNPIRNRNLTPESNVSKQSIQTKQSVQIKKPVQERGEIQN